MQATVINQRLNSAMAGLLANPFFYEHINFKSVFFTRRRRWMFYGGVALFLFFGIIF